MKQPGFNEIIDEILAKDPRYDREAYVFLRDSLDFTLKKLRRNSNVGAPSHVSPRELLEGVRQYALEQFGPMVRTVFDFWNIRDSADIGQIVFNLIESGVFGKSDHDRIEDFYGALDFHKAFVEPFEPRPAPAPEPARSMQPVRPS